MTEDGLEAIEWSNNQLSFNSNMWVGEFDYGEGLNYSGYLSFPSID